MRRKRVAVTHLNHGTITRPTVEAAEAAARDAARDEENRVAIEMADEALRRLGYDPETGEDLRADGATEEK